MKRSNLFAVLLLLLTGLGPIPSPGALLVQNGLSHQKDVQPGETWAGSIILTNTSEEEYAEAKVFQNDYLFFADGSADYAKAGSVPRSNSSWMTVSPSRVQIPPRGNAEVRFTVHVPAKQDLNGTYWSMVMVEAVPKDSPEKSGKVAPKEQVSMTIKEVIQYGIQIATSIGDTGDKTLSFKKFSLQREGEKRLLRIEAENTGQRMVRAQPWAEVYDQNGSRIGRFSGLRLRTYPGTSVTYSIDVTLVPGGSYKCVIVAESLEGDLFGVETTLEIKE